MFPNVSSLAVTPLLLTMAARFPSLKNLTITDPESNVDYCESFLTIYAWPAKSP